MNTKLESFKTGLRIVWTIGAKDTLEAVKNKTILSVFLGMALMVLSAQALPLLSKINPIPKAAIYDAGNSEMVKALKSSDQFRIYKSASQQEMERRLGEANDIVLGLVIPAGFDEQLSSAQGFLSGDPPEIDGYAIHWASRAEIRQLQLFFEQQLSDITGKTVHIQIKEARVYPQTDAVGGTFMASMILVLVILLMGGLLVPFLISEEKETHTLEALLVSPASISQMVAGKALAGSVYSLFAAGIVLFINRGIVVHWSLALLTVLFGAAFAVGLGLFVGSMLGDQQTTSLISNAIFIVLLLAVLLSVLVRPGWPAIVQSVLPWIPSVALANVFRISFSGSLPVEMVLVNLGIVLLFTIPLYAAAIWKLSRIEF